MAKVLVAAVPILAGSAVIIGLRWRINILSLGDDDAASLGVNPGRLRALLLTMVALMTAGAVAVSGVIGWVGLVVPHIARLWVGPDHRISMPTTFRARCRLPDDHRHSLAHGVPARFRSASSPRSSVRRYSFCCCGLA